MAWWRRARDFAVVFRRQCSVSRFNVAAAQDMHEPHRLLREFANRVTAAERRSALFRIPPRRVVAGQRPRKLRWPIALTRRALRGSPARFFDSPLSPLQRTCNRRQRGSYAHPRSCSAPSHRLSPPGSNRSRLRYTCDTEEKQPLINIAADHSRGEVLLDALDRGGRGGLEEPGFELLAVGAVVDPAAGGCNPLAGRDRGGMADQGDQLPVATGPNPDDAKAILGVLVRDALGQSGEHLVIGWCGLALRAGRHP